jgi:hypothetical protein
MPPGVPQFNPNGTIRCDAKGKQIHTPLLDWLEEGAWKRLSDQLVTEIAARWPEAFDRGGRP